MTRLLLHVWALAVVMLACFSASIAHAQSDAEDAAQQVWVRLTYYVVGGLTYGGGQTFLGSGACSWNFALGTTFEFVDGEQIYCNDRGLLGGAPGWLDVYAQPALAHKYGDYALVTVR